jgi:hypothetical protein
MGRHSGSQPRCDDLGLAGFLRSGAPADLLGYRQPFPTPEWIVTAAMLLRFRLPLLPISTATPPLR